MDFKKARVGGWKLVEPILKTIKNRSIRRFTEDALTNSSNGFWVSPCSSTGEYHPPENQVAGGIIIHSVKAVVIAREYAIFNKLSPFELDCTIVATLLHDIEKYGRPWGKRTDPTHGYLGWLYLERYRLNIKAKEIIRNAVRYHMAQWVHMVDPYRESFSKKELGLEREELIRALNPTKVERAVQLADYFSSRRQMSYLPERTIIFDKRTHNTSEEWLDNIQEPY